MRCPECNKFVSYDTEVDPEVIEVVTEHDVDDAGKGSVAVTATVRRVLTCEECSTELKENEFVIEETVDACACVDAEKNPIEFDSEEEFSPTVRTEGKGRGTKTFYGVDGAVTITCLQCEHTLIVALKADEGASSFEELG